MSMLSRAKVFWILESRSPVEALLEFANAKL
jgi:hypothetical protein